MAGTKIREVSVLHAWHDPVDYSASLSEMESRHSDVVQGLSDSCIMITRHCPVKTCGLLDHPSGSDWIKVHRGGSLTYHDDGQVVVYPILRLDFFDILPAQYTAWLQEWVCKAIQFHGRSCRTIEGKIGVWVDNGHKLSKVAFIGTRVRKLVSLHGFAINLYSALDRFAEFLPCGSDEIEVSNLEISIDDMVNSIILTCPLLCRMVHIGSYRPN